ncbi:unnamed protein product [Merluccius merluccius]
MTRLEETKARVTSIFGEILKMESTKKIAKKLAGAAAGSAAWMSNMGNEYGQVLVSVLTAAEGDGLSNMAAGLMRRYREAAPKVLYVDWDCCAAVGASTTDSHQLFAIFEWDGEDVARLKEAKQSSEGGGGDAQEVKLSAKELARHCRRRTRGAAETERLLQEVLDAFWEVTDSMGVPLIDRARMEEIWSTQRRHLDCIQDPEGVELYTKTGEVTKGGVRLPVFRCARGSTSLESFHLHQCCFIPGTTASDVHYQVYLLEGLVRWNENRGRAAVQGGPRAALRCYSAQLQHSFNQLALEVGVQPVDDFTQPREYTGELLGVEYLYSQLGAVLQPYPVAPDGTEDDEDDDGGGRTYADEGFEEEEEEEEPDVVGPDGHPGYHHVVALAHGLVELRHHAFVTVRQTREIVALWERLTERDKSAVTFPPPATRTSWSKVHIDDAKTLAGARLNCWGAIMRDYKQIQDNVLYCPALMASTHIQLYDVNQRTLSMW